MPNSRIDRSQEQVEALNSQADSFEFGIDLVHLPPSAIDPRYRHMKLLVKPGSGCIAHLFDITLADLFTDGRLVIGLVHRLEQLVLVGLCDVGLFLELADFRSGVDLALWTSALPYLYFQITPTPACSAPSAQCRNILVLTWTGI